MLYLNRTKMTESVFPDPPNYELCGQIFGCSSGAFQYNCNFCAEVFNQIAEFKSHVLGHLLKECITILPDISPFKDANAEGCPTVIDIKVESTLTADTESINSFNDDSQMHSPEAEFNTPEECPSESKDQPLLELRNCHVTLRDIAAAVAATTIENDVKCDCCYEKFACNGLRDLHAHQSVPTFVKCPDCPTFYPNRKERLHHLRVHSLPSHKQFRCPHCGRIFADKESMLSHINVNKRIDILPNNIHFFVHNPGKKVERQFECDICGRAFHKRHSIEKHLIEHVRTQLRCTICDRTCTSKGNLARHILTHTGAKPFKCPICHKAFTHSPYVKVHMRSHTGERPCVCSICGKRFGSTNKLNIHIRHIHERVKKHVCDTCGESFREQYLLQNHIRSRHTMERPFACVVCGSAFTSKKVLRQHALLHNEKKFKCNYCDKMFAQSAGRRCHEKLQHNAI